MFYSILDKPSVSWNKLLREKNILETRSYKKKKICYRFLLATSLTYVIQWWHLRRKLSYRHLIWNQTQREHLLWCLIRLTINNEWSPVNILRWISIFTKSFKWPEWNKSTTRDSITIACKNMTDVESEV